MSRADTHSEVVVWDLGNVLIPWDRARAIEVAVGDSAEARRICDTVFTMELNEVVDVVPDMVALRRRSEEVAPGCSWIVEAYVEHFAHSLGPIIEGSARLLEELSDQDVRCIGLSNFSALTFGGIPQRYPVLERLEGVLISGEVGLAKPDPAIYRLCEQQFGLDPLRVVFIDDSAPNVAAARAVGWDAIRFSDPVRLRAELAERGMPVAPV